MEVGVRKLKQKASQLVRLVREQGQVIQITYHGKVVAKLSPTGPGTRATESEEAWATLEQLALEIGAAGPEGLSAVEAVAESRA